MFLADLACAKSARKRPDRVSLALFTLSINRTKKAIEIYGYFYFALEILIGIFLVKILIVKLILLRHMVEAHGRTNLPESVSTTFLLPRVLENGLKKTFRCAGDQCGVMIS